MKKVFINIIFLFISLNAFSLPVSSGSVFIGADAAADILTVAELSNSSIWYRTVMPGYRLDCRWDYLPEENKLHRFDFGFRYFESNLFTFNTVQLEAGTVRTLMFNLGGDYKRYLPITANIDYISGVGLAGYYNSFGLLVSNNGAKINDSFSLKVGPINGFSINIQDKFEFDSLLCLAGGIPLWGKISYPEEIEMEVLSVDLGMSIRSSATLHLKIFSLSLFYDWSHDYILSLADENDSFDPLAVCSQSVHSIGLKAGVRI